MPKRDFAILTNGLGNSGKDNRQLMKDFFVRDSDHLVAFAIHDDISSTVFFSLFRDCVVATVDFNHKFSATKGEVGDIRITDWHLPAAYRSKLSLPEILPQLTLCGCDILT